MLRWMSVPTLIDDSTANNIEFYLIQNGYVDMDRKVTDKYREEIKNGTVAELPESTQTDGRRYPYSYSGCL